MNSFYNSGLRKVEWQEKLVRWRLTLKLVKAPPRRRDCQSADVFRDSSNSLLMKILKLKNHSEGLKGWKLKKRCRVAESQQLNGGPSRTQLAKLCMPCAPTRGPDGMEAPSSRSSPNLVQSIPSLVHPPFSSCYPMWFGATQCQIHTPLPAAPLS